MATFVSTTKGQLEVVDIDDCKVRILSRTIERHLDGMLSFGDMPIIVDGLDGTVLCVFKVNDASNHIVLAAQAVSDNAPLLFVGYRRQLGTWRPWKKKAVIDPEAHLECAVRAGDYSIANLHTYYLRCCG